MRQAGQSSGRPPAIPSPAAQLSRRGGVPELHMEMTGFLDDDVLGAERHTERRRNGRNDGVRDAQRHRAVVQRLAHVVGVHSVAGHGGANVHTVRARRDDRGVAKLVEYVGDDLVGQRHLGCQRVEEYP